jgi:ABC-type glutathione transport system ATPase component
MAKWWERPGAAMKSYMKKRAAVQAASALPPNGNNGSNGTAESLLDDNKSSVPSRGPLDSIDGRYKQILHDVSFSVQPGEVLGILGSSGSGKTTLLNVMACRAAGGKQQGQVAVNGIPFTQNIARQCAGYVMQGLPHFSLATSWFSVGYVDTVCVSYR